MHDSVNVPGVLNYRYLNTVTVVNIMSVLCAESLSHVQLFATPWTVAHQAPLSMGFSRQEYWSGLPFPPPGDLPDPGIEPACPVSLAMARVFFTTEPPAKKTSQTPSLLSKSTWSRDFSRTGCFPPTVSSLLHSQGQTSHALSESLLRAPTREKKHSEAK